MSLSRGLQAITNGLEQKKDLTPEVLAECLRHEVSIDDVAPFIHFGEENYVRNLIKKTDRWELRLLCWRPDQSSALHGHGPSACAFKIIRGTAFETALGSRDRTFTPGNVVIESDVRVVHQVGNAAQDPLITLHAYSPPLPVDSPSPRRGRNIVVVGGGFGGAAVVYHLLKRGDANLRVTWIERGPWLGRGIAYGVDSPIFRLNVPAAKMSLDPAAPNDFVEFAGAEEDPHQFLSRSRYGAYVVDRLMKAIRESRSKVRLVRSDAVGLEPNGVRTIGGHLLEAETIVLATGLAPRVVPKRIADDPRILDAWDECGLATLPRDGRILILGAGLSALDVVNLLEMRGFKGSATILSRRGVLPRPHLTSPHPPIPISAEAIANAPSSLPKLIRFVRSHVEKVHESGQPWQAAFDGLRPHVTALWQKLSPDDRRRFVKNVRPYWDVFRHRAPSDALAIVDRWTREGRLEVIAGRVLDCEPREDSLDVHLYADRDRHERYDRLVRCIGPALEADELRCPLVSSLIESGLAQIDGARLGIVTDSTGRVVSRTGRASDRLFAIGALRRASSWETTAVPDISKHAQEIAEKII